MRENERIIAVKLVLVKGIMSFGCAKDDKNKFWQDIILGWTTSKILKSILYRSYLFYRPHIHLHWYLFEKQL